MSEKMVIRVKRFFPKIIFFDKKIIKIVGKKNVEMSVNQARNGHF